MEIFFWFGLFFILILLTVIIFARGAVSRINQHTDRKIEALEEKVKHLEEKLNNRVS